MYKHIQINHTIIYVFVYIHKCTYTMSYLLAGLACFWCLVLFCFGGVWKGHMRHHYVLWNMSGTGHYAHFLLPVWKILAHPTTTWPHPNLLASTLRGAMACSWHVPHSNGFSSFAECARMWLLHTTGMWILDNG